MWPCKCALPAGLAGAINPRKRRSVEQGRQRQDHRSVGRPRRRCGPHPLRPRPLRAGAELPPSRIISLTVAWVFKHWEFHEFRHPQNTRCRLTEYVKMRALTVSEDCCPSPPIVKNLARVREII